MSSDECIVGSKISASSAADAELAKTSSLAIKLLSLILLKLTHLCLDEK